MTALAFMMLITFNGQREPELYFTTRSKCEQSKPQVSQQYPSSQRSKLKLRCLPR